MLNNSRIAIYEYIESLMINVSENIYPMGEPIDNTDSDDDDGFIVINVGVLNDDSEFEGEAYAWARCTVTAYVPKKVHGRLNKDLYKYFEDGINDAIKVAQSDVESTRYILPESVVSMDDDENLQQGNQYHLFVKSFVVVIDQE